jgi:hypothetical protein
LSLTMSYRQSAEKPGGEFERLQLNATNIFHSTTRAAKRDREVGPAVRGRGGESRRNRLAISISCPRPMPSILFRAMETYGNIWKHLGNIWETFGQLFPFAFTTETQRAQRNRLLGWTLTSFRSGLNILSAG